MAENSPRRPGLAIHDRRGSHSANRKGEPHPTVMRTLAAQPRRAERLCQGTCPGPSRYSYAPSSAAIQKTTGSLPEGSVPLGTAGGWGGSSGRRLLRYRGRGLVGGREDVGMAQSQARYHWDSVTLIPHLSPDPPADRDLFLRPSRSKYYGCGRRPIKPSGYLGGPRPHLRSQCSPDGWGRRRGWPTAAPVRLRLAGRPVAQCLRNLSILKTSFFWSMC